MPACRRSTRVSSTQLARSRLKAGGYVSQWLPAYQVPAESSLAMVRAFLDVFPQSVLLSGAQAELLLVGTTASRIELDPIRVAATLAREPAVREDLARLDLGSVREIAGTFVGSAETLARATRASPRGDRRSSTPGIRRSIGPQCRTDGRSVGALRRDERRRLVSALRGGRVGRARHIRSRSVSASAPAGLSRSSCRRRPRRLAAA